MGATHLIDAERYPDQGQDVNERVSVWYHSTSHIRHTGTRIRHDIAAPYRTILALDNGRILDATECHYELIP